MRIGLVGRRPLIDGAVAHVQQHRRGVIFLGEAGVGKTRLLDETLARLDEAGWYTERFVASEATQGVAFAPLGQHFPTEGGDLTQLVANFRQSLEKMASERPIAIAFDDAHLLDELTLACLVDVVHHSDVVVLCTARTTDPMPPALTSLWSSEALERLSVEPLERDEAIEFIKRVLMGVPEEDLAEQAIDRTGGVPLFLRELLLDGVDAHTIVPADGRWRAVGDLRSGERLRELVKARLQRLDTASRSLLELMAVAEPLPMSHLTVDEQAVLARLEERGTARAETIAGRWVARVDHPVVGEAIVGALPVSRRLEHLRDAAKRTVDRGCPHPGDALRVVDWSREAGIPIDIDIAIAAGREAIGTLDLDTAVALARPTLDERPLEGNLLLGEALRLQTKVAEAEEALTRAAELADDDEIIVRVAMWHSTLRAHHAEDPEGAMALLNEAADRVRHDRRALELRSEAAFLAGILGRFDLAIETNRNILRTPGIDEATTWTSLINLLFAQVMMADLSDIETTIEQAAAMIDEIYPVRPEGVDLYWALRSCAALLLGKLVEYEERMIAHVQQCIMREQLHGITAAVVTNLLLVRGSDQAVAVGRHGCADLAASDPYLVAPIANACLTVAVADHGDVDAAVEALALVDTSYTADARSLALIGRAQAAVAALKGDIGEACSIAIDTGRRSIASTYVLFGALPLYDVVRYGRGDQVIDDLEAIATSTDAPLLRLMADHARGQATGDASLLDRVATEALAIGARSIAIDAFADASHAHEPTAAARSATLAAMWMRATPVVSAFSRPARASLSQRELEAAALAITGESSKAIAERLFVSVRTVDNHLANVYRKLDVSGRGELRTVLSQAPGFASGEAAGT